MYLRAASPVSEGAKTTKCSGPICRNDGAEQRPGVVVWIRWGRREKTKDGFSGSTPLYRMIKYFRVGTVVDEQWKGNYQPGESNE